MLFARLLLGFSFSSPQAALAQDTLVVVFGMVKDITTKEPLQDVQVDAIDLKYGRRVMATLFQGRALRTGLCARG